MDVFESKPLKLVSAAFYIVLMFLSFYCACYRLPVGLKYAINLLIFGWACAMFFLRPMFNRAIFCLRFFALFFFPYLMFWMWSVAIWISEFQTFNYILRGSLNIFYMLTNLMFASAAVYMFGEATMPLTLVGMTMANVSNFKNHKAKAFRFSTLDALCEILDCQPGDLLEYVSGESEKE